MKTAIKGDVSVAEGAIESLRDYCGKKCGIVAGKSDTVVLEDDMKTIQLQTCAI